MKMSEENRAAMKRILNGGGIAHVMEKTISLHQQYFSACLSEG